MIEVLVVLVILGVLAGFALLTLPAATSTADPATQLRQTLQQLCIESLDQATPIALVVNRGEVLFQRWEAGWQPYESRLLRPGRLPSGWGSVRIPNSGHGDGDAQRLVCSADGELTPARVELSAAEPLVIQAGNRITAASR